MIDQGISTVQALSIAGSTLAFGFVFGWIYALLHFGSSSDNSNHKDKEEQP